MKKKFAELLAKLECFPVLLDIGASGGTPEIWQPIAPASTYIGFDPDLRETREVSEGIFQKAIIVNQAVTADPGATETTFYLTKSPYCSSTLKPDAASLANFQFADHFTVEREVKMQATSLDAVMTNFKLSRVDWFKVDSQGTDLRLFNSLKTETRARVLAVDIEPGLIDAYQGEDLFVDAHRNLTQQGFWLSNLNVMGAVRVRKASLAKISAGRLLEKAIRPSPGWCEARYLRTLEHLRQARLDRQDYRMLWVFALLDNQPGFALDLAVEYQELFGDDKAAGLMLGETRQRLQQAAPLATAKSVAGRAWARGNRIWHNRKFFS